MIGRFDQLLGAGWVPRVPVKVSVLAGAVAQLDCPDEDAPRQIVAMAMGYRRKLISTSAPSKVCVNIALRRHAPGLICAKGLELADNIMSDFACRLSRCPRLDIGPRHAVIGVDSPRVEITYRPACIAHGVIPTGD